MKFNAKCVNLWFSTKGNQNFTENLMRKLVLPTPESPAITTWNGYSLEIAIKNSGENVAHRNDFYLTQTSLKCH